LRNIWAGISASESQISLVLRDRPCYAIYLQMHLLFPATTEVLNDLHKCRDIEFLLRL
jgi:hypothetical protein